MKVEMSALLQHSACDVPDIHATRVIDITIIMLLHCSHLLLMK